MIITKTNYLVILPFLLLFACAKSNIIAKPVQESIIETLILNKTWQVENINQLRLIYNSHVTLIFSEDNRVSGKSGCNNYAGGYTLTGSKLAVIAPMIRTRMMCAPAMMNQENEYIDLLTQAEKVDLSPMGVLIITSQTGNMIRLMSSQ